MPKRISLRARIFVLSGSLFLLILAGGAFSLWSLRGIGATLGSAVVQGGEIVLNEARNLEISLVLQALFLQKYLGEGQPEWLNRLDQQRRLFGESLKTARDASPAGNARDALTEIESRFLRYRHLQDQFIRIREEGKGDTDLARSPELEGEFQGIREACEDLVRLTGQHLGEARAGIQTTGRTLENFLLIFFAAMLVSGLATVYLLIRRVLDPIRELAYTTDPDGKADPPEDEVETLSRHVRNLMENVDQTQSQLQISREHLLQSGKLAMVGKLAAGVAHSVRNPLTSVKMRLFSLGRSLRLAPDQKEDFEVIASEIRHIDTVLQNFLEFSRPPKLKMQQVSPSDVVDAAIQLLRHRIESYDVAVELYRKRRLPQIEGDPEQLKEVLVNLVINACEAMTEGGNILIQEEEGFSEPMGRVAVIKISDDGPGIPESIKDRVFQPFFSTKEEGTGLGLSIAVRIIEDHRGCLNVRSRRGKGTTFTITLPSKEGEAWLRS